MKPSPSPFALMARVQLVQLTALALSSCAVNQPTAASASKPGPLAIQQAEDGRFITCRDCARPTPKSLALLAPAPSKDRVVLPRPPALPAMSAASGPSSSGQASIAQRVERATLNFASGSARLDARAEQALVALRPLLAQARSLRVVGLTDNVGTQVANDQLADARALAVLLRVRELIGGGPHGPVLSALGRGRCCYLNDNGSGTQRALNRRAELVVTLVDDDATDTLVARHAHWLNHRASTTKVTQDVPTTQ